MGKCKDCVFWGDWRPRECGQIGRLGQDPESDIDIQVSVLDDSGLNAYIVTGPEFGCVNFSPKKNKKK